MANYYHASVSPIAVGSVLESRFIKQVGKFQFDAVASALGEGDWVVKSLLLADFLRESGKPFLAFVLKESIMEDIRVTEFSDRPSRFNSVFLCAKKRDIARFRAIVRQGNDRPYLYRCTIEGDLPTFEGDAAFVSSTNVLDPIQAQLDDLKNRARLYWSGAKSEEPVMEVLVAPGTATVTAVARW